MDWAWSLAAQRRLPSLETPYPPIPTTQLLAWEREGHTLTRSLCTSEELKDYAKVVRAAFEREKLAAFRQKVRVLLGPEAFEECQTLEECEEVMEEYVDPDAVPFLQTFNGWRQFQDVRRLALAKRFARVAAELLNVSPEGGREGRRDKGREGGRGCLRASWAFDTRLPPRR